MQAGENGHLWVSFTAFNENLFRIFSTKQWSLLLGIKITRVNMDYFVGVVLQAKKNQLVYDNSLSCNNDYGYGLIISKY